MAYVANLIDDEDEKNKQQQNTGVVGEKTSSGQSSTISESGAGDPAPQDDASQSTKSGGGSGWTNLAQYTTANQNNDANMANAIATTQQAKLSAAQQIGDELGREASSGAEKGKLTDFGTMESQLASDPTKIEKSEFDKYYNYDYAGPSKVEELGSYQKAQDAFGGLGKVSEASKGFEGVANLLQETYDDGGYSRGENLLDAFITRSGDRGQQALGDMRQNFATEQDKYQGNLGGYQDILGEAGQTAQQQGDQFRQSTQSLYDQLLQEVQASKTGAQGALGSGFYGSTGAPMSWITGEEDLQGYIDEGTAQEAKARALSSLMGEEYQTTDFGALGDQLLQGEQESLQSQIDAYLNQLAADSAQAESERLVAEQPYGDISGGVTNTTMSGAPIDEMIVADFGDDVGEAPYEPIAAGVGRRAVSDVSKKLLKKDPVRNVVLGRWG